MSEAKREYNGAALNSFIVALGHSEGVIQKLLNDAGVERIDPERWYDYEWAISIFYKIEKEIGRSALLAVGKKMIETAPYPPGIDSIATLLMSLGEAFRLNARGPEVGEVVCTIEDEHSAILDWSAKGPCALCMGILEGSCSRYGAKALVEHGASGCKDHGAPTCIYHVSW
ncbi:MAG: hypothetical protein R6X02_08315 [Enhygromyxa sp.]